MFTTMMATTRPRGRHHSMHSKTIVAIIVGYEVPVMFIHSSRRNRGRRLLPRRDSRLGSRPGGDCAIAASTSAVCGSDEGGSRAKDCVELGVNGGFDVDRVGGCFGVDEGDEDA